MNAATCQVLATVFPVVMLTVVVERRTIKLRLRRMRWFRGVMLWSFGCALFGLGVTVGGVQFDGLDTVWGAGAWLLATLSIAGLGVVLLASMATTEADEDAELTSAA